MQLFFHYQSEHTLVIHGSKNKSKAFKIYYFLKCVNNWDKREDGIFDWRKTH